MTHETAADRDPAAILVARAKRARLLLEMKRRRGLPLVVAGRDAVQAENAVAWIALGDKSPVVREDLRMDDTSLLLKCLILEAAQCKR